MYHEAIDPYKNFTASSQEKKWFFRDHNGGDSVYNQLQLFLGQTSDIVFNIEVLLFQEQGSHACNLDEKKNTEGLELFMT